MIASLDSDRPGHIRDRAIILLLAIYGLRIGEVCALTLDDLDWNNEKIRVRRPKNRTIQEFPLTAEVGNAILKYLQLVRPQCSSRNVFLLLRGPHRPMRVPCLPLHFSSSSNSRMPSATLWASRAASRLRHPSAGRRLLAQGESVITSATAQRGRRESTRRSTARNWDKLPTVGYRP